MVTLLFVFWFESGLGSLVIHDFDRRDISMGPIGIIPILRGGVLDGGSRHIFRDENNGWDFVVRRSCSPEMLLSDSEADDTDDYFTLNFSIPYGLRSCLWYRLPPTTALVWVSSWLAFVLLGTLSWRRDREQEEVGEEARPNSGGWPLACRAAFSDGWASSADLFIFSRCSPLSLSLCMSLGLFILTIVAS